MYKKKERSMKTTFMFSGGCKVFIFCFDLTASACRRDVIFSDGCALKYRVVWRINLWLSWLGGQWYPQPTRVQILVLTLFLDLFQGFRRCAFSGRRRSRRRRGAYDDFVNLKMICRSVSRRCS